jgi:hypothetical protein
MLTEYLLKEMRPLLESSVCSGIRNKCRHERSWIAYGNLVNVISLLHFSFSLSICFSVPETISSVYDFRLKFCMRVSDLPWLLNVLTMSLQCFDYRIKVKLNSYPLRPSGNYMYHLLFIISDATFCIYVFRMILGINSDYFLEQR